MNKPIPMDIKLAEFKTITTIYTGISWTRCQDHRKLTPTQFNNLVLNCARRDKLILAIRSQMKHFLPFTKKYNKFKKAIWKLIDQYSNINLVHCCQAQNEFKNENLIVDNWHAGHQRHLLGTNTAADNFQIDYIALGTGYTAPAAGQTSITTEIFRGAPTTSYAADNKTTVFILGVSETDANPAYSGTTVATVAGTTSTTTSIVIGSGETSSLTVEDRVQIGLGTGNEYGTIETIDATTNTFTLYAADALTAAPAAADEVTITWGNIGLVGGSANATLGTGTLYSDAQVQFAKTAAKYTTIEAQVVTASITGS